jgi:hypothetical protein
MPTDAAKAIVRLNTEEAQNRGNFAGISYGVCRFIAPRPPAEAAGTVMRVQA